jgi:hypothetical protein
MEAISITIAESSIDGLCNWGLEWTFVCPMFVVGAY